MSEKIDNPPAFPASVAMTTSEGQYSHATLQSGMALRDYFAGQALQAFVAEYFKGNGMCFGSEHLFKNLPAHAYQMADAMLKERLK